MVNAIVDSSNEDDLGFPNQVAIAQMGIYSKREHPSSSQYLQQISWLQWKQPHGNKEFPWNIELE
jgi:hypothetical protein